MITAKFFGRSPCYSRVDVTGHAGYAPAGEDIVCAAVTSAVQLTANGITEILSGQGKVTVSENLISIRLSGSPTKESEHFLQALYLQLSLLAEDYPGTIQVIVSEV